MRTTRKKTKQGKFYLSGDAREIIEKNTSTSMKDTSKSFNNSQDKCKTITLIYTIYK